jgi:hypothetical protein
MVAPLDQVLHVVARDPASRAFVVELDALCRRLSGDGATVTMFDVALSYAGLEPVRVPVTDFGKLVPFSRGGKA